MNRTRVKICGITRPEDGVEAARLGADAVGLVFYGASPRAVTPAQAREVVAALPPFVTTVGLFVDAERAEIDAVLEAVPLDLLQFHGSESPEACRGFHRPYIKAVAMRDGVDLHDLVRQHHDAAGLLLDAYRPGVPGGTGEVFDWERVPRDLALPVILAGGLHPGNVAAAVACARPYAVDVSSGVEAAKGIKDHERLAAFFAALTEGGDPTQYDGQRAG